jgi:S1-C subfamily serine protease
VQWPAPPQWQQDPPQPQQWPQHPAQQWPQQPPPARGPFGKVPVVLGALVLVVLAGIGLLAWGVGRSPSAGPVAAATTPVAQPQSTDPSVIAGKVAPGLVNINTVLGYQGAQAAGTGMVLTSNGEVLTNNHVVEGATQIQVTDVGNGQTYQATTVGYDRTHDIAVLQLQGASGLTTVTTGNSTSVALGDQVIGIGNAGGVGGTPSIAPGAVTALNQSITATDQSGANAETLTGLIQISANIQAGDSGGPLVNSAGQVVGMDTAASTGSRFNGRAAATSGATPATVQGFAIPINDALAVAHQIESSSASTTVHIGASAMLGVSVVDPSTLGGAAAQGVAPVSGAVVGDVLPGGPAALAGLAAGDVITSVDGLSIASPTTLTTVLDQHHPGDKVSVTYLDQALQQHTATAVLAAGPVG